MVYSSRVEDHFQNNEKLEDHLTEAFVNDNKHLHENYIFLYSDSYSHCYLTDIFENVLSQFSDGEIPCLLVL